MLARARERRIFGTSFSQIRRWPIIATKQRILVKEFSKRRLKPTCHLKQYLLKKTMKNLFVGSLQQKLRSCCQEYCWLVAAMMISCFFFNNAFLANRLNYFKKYETFHLPLQNKKKRETRNPNILILFVFIFLGEERGDTGENDLLKSVPTTDTQTFDSLTHRTLTTYQKRCDLSK